MMWFWSLGSSHIQTTTKARPAGNAFPQNANEPHIDCNSFNVTFSYRKTIFIFISRFWTFFSGIFINIFTVSILRPKYSIMALLFFHLLLEHQFHYIFFQIAILNFYIHLYPFHHQMKNHLNNDQYFLIQICFNYPMQKCWKSFKSGTWYKTSIGIHLSM